MHMIELQDFEYTPQIEATEENARAIQALTLQDVVAGGFENPTSLANPNDHDQVWEQLMRLRRRPELYSAYMHQESGLLVAYEKSGKWRAGDERPFADENILAQMSLMYAKMLRSGSLKPNAYGVFGLVADKELAPDVRDEILNRMLVKTMGRAAAESAAVVNMVLHNQDPALHVATDLGFIPVGRRGEAAGAPGLMQQRYQRPVTGLSSLLQ